MAIIFMGSAEMKDMGIWDATGGVVAINTTTKRSGTSSFKGSGNGAYLLKYFSNLSEIWGQVAFNPGSTWATAGTIQRVLSFRLDSTYLITLGYNPNTWMFNAYTGDRTTLLQGGTVMPRYGTGGFIVLEFYIKLSDGSGVVQTWLGGIPDINFSGDTKPGAETTFNNVVVGLGTNTIEFYVDDILLADSSQRFYGASIVALSPTGSGTHSEWTPSAGNNYACVDEIPSVNTDYIFAPSVNLIDTYALTNLPTGADVILGTQANLYQVLQQGLSPVTSVAPIFRMSGTDRVGTSSLSSFASQNIKQFYPVSPATEIAWSLAEINEMEFGVKALA